MINPGLRAPVAPSKGSSAASLPAAFPPTGSELEYMAKTWSVSLKTLPA